MAYITLGSRTLTAVADTTGRNAGNYTNWFTQAVLNTNVPFFECYKIVFSGALLLATLTVDIDNIPWSFATAGPGGGSEWDPVNVMLLRPGNEVFFFWNTASTDTHAPAVSLWLRYDDTNRANKNAGF